MKTMYVKSRKYKSIQNMMSLIENFHLISGPCSVESLEQMEQTAQLLMDSGLKFIRGGAFKPRTSPYDFQGIGLDGLKILNHIRKKYGLLVVSEILDPRDMETASEYIDIIQIGSRNMHNYTLLKEAGKSDCPILLKRGMMSTYEEFLLSAEYIVCAGNEKIILCERGIRTFEKATRNTLDLSCVALVKKETSLPIIVDLSHSLGRKDILPLMINCVKALGADGIMLEIHPNPKEAKSDNAQQLSLEEFHSLLPLINGV